MGWERDIAVQKKKKKITLAGLKEPRVDPGQSNGRLLQQSREELVLGMARSRFNVCGGSRIARTF